jgi:trimeric autotransporter adhesin
MFSLRNRRAARKLVPSVSPLEGREMLSGTPIQVVFGAHTVSFKQVDGTPIATEFTPIPGTLHYLNVRGVNFEGDDLSGLDFTGSAFHGTDFLGATLARDNFTDCAFWDPDFTQADVRNATFSFNPMWNATYSGANFTGDDLSTVWNDDPIDGWVPLATTQIVNAQGSVLATVGGTSLQGANLAGMNLTGAQLQGADLSGSDLSGDNLSGANLTGANLVGANLTGANLKASNDSHANFQGDDLRFVEFAGPQPWFASYGDRPDFSYANLSYTNISGNYLFVNLLGTNLAGANLSGTFF